MIYKIGAHLSIVGGYDKALKRIKNIGGNCLQIFSTTPRGWSLANIDEVKITKFLDYKKKLKVDPVYFHVSYLINLADEGKIGHLSKLSLISELSICPKLHIKGSIVHLGSYKNQKIIVKYQTLIKHIKEILDNTPSDSLLIIENAGNRKIGNRLEEIAQIIRDADNDRIKVCLDTCHLFSAGYSLKNNKELNFLINKLNKLDLLKTLELFHINDSRDPLGSLRDRHENIGQGTIGLESFRTLLNHPKTKNYPFIIETPGFNDEGPDKKNIDILKSLVL